MVNQRKKGKSGAATNYVTRKRALKKLQLGLKDFRRLCILKGIFPHEPHNKKKLQNGSSESKIFYFAKDIAFLAQEPIINQFRDYKVFLRKLNHAKAKKQEAKYKQMLDSVPEYDLTRIVKERYPTFQSALRELDDALCLCFIFARLPRVKAISTSLINDCQRLTAEFMHYVIEARAVTNSFVSIKGIYYQAEVCGEKITWVVAHDRGLHHISNVDFHVLATFAEFYVAMLSFVNFRLFSSIGLVYPPQITTGEQHVTNAAEDEGDEDEEVLEKIYSLAKPLAKRSDAEADEGDDMDNFEGDDEDEANTVMKQMKALRVLFTGCTFWLNREAPKESLAFLIRSCGGSVAWEGSPIDMEEDDNAITHQVVDRPLQAMTMSRLYVQPQWVYDSVNARRLLKSSLYAPGAALPPHLSPFHAERAGDYVPVERMQQLREQGVDTSDYITVDSVQSSEKETKKDKKPKMEKQKSSVMSVAPGKMHKINQQRIVNLQGESRKMREMMLPRKTQGIYEKLKKGIRRSRTEGNALAVKRRRLEEARGKKGKEVDAN